jgi:hypothetical protein
VAGTFDGQIFVAVVGPSVRGVEIADALFSPSYRPFKHPTHLA